MPGIRDAHNYLATSILNGLAITSPYTKTIKRAWKFIPPMRSALADYPCAFSTYELRGVRFQSALLNKLYTIHIQLVAGPAAIDADQQADIASAFLEALITKLALSSTTLTLGGNVSLIQELRGSSPDTLTILEWGGIGYVGCDLFLDVQTTQVPGYSS